MFATERLGNVTDYFLGIDERPSRGVYMCRITGFGSGIKSFLTKYMSECSKNGVFISGGMKNPDASQTEHYRKCVGEDFEISLEFIRKKLDVWLEGADGERKAAAAELLFAALERLKENGKSTGIIKNVFIKYMCLLYYTFMPVFKKKRKYISKIIYDGVPSKSESELLRIVCGSGCDLLITAFDREEEYGKTDPDNEYTQRIVVKNPMVTPKNFELYALFRENPENNEGESEKRNTFVSEKASERRIKIKSETRPEIKPQTVPETNRKPSFSYYPFPKAAGTVCPNAWIKESMIKGNVSEACLTGHNERGEERGVYYNVFAYIKGIWDGYAGDICRLCGSLEKAGRELVVVTDIIPAPDNDEIAAAGERAYNDERELITGLCRKIEFPDCIELERLVRRAFYDIMNEGGESFQRKTSRAVTLVCLIRRYIPRLFRANRLSAHPVFLYWGSARNSNEADFLRILAASSADVLILDSDLESRSVLEDKFLFKTEYPKTRLRSGFPYKAGSVGENTVSYEAERELDTVLYENTGLYRTGQFAGARSVILRTTFEEISILWKEDAKYRPGFSAESGEAAVPVIFAKISGVPGNKNNYFRLLDRLSENAFIIDGFPYIDGSEENKAVRYAAGFYKRGKLLRDKIKQSPCYKYGFIRAEMQEHILESAEKLIKSELITGTHKSGAEYAVAAVALDFKKEILHMLQRFDFTGSIPKVVVTAANENMPSLEDAVLLALLSYIGFDVVIFSPGGYCTVEKYYNKNILVNHIIGEYIFDMDMSEKRQNTGIFGKIFGNSMFGKEW
ncbi:MAG: hypothetical protein J1F64_08600 [Oscillospiraceae bacterium]|nr:hypothetical protein [Oscillospiraceae bacterium]